jgi:hypothetical protein
VGVAKRPRELTPNRNPTRNDSLHFFIAVCLALVAKMDWKINPDARG